MILSIVGREKLNLPLEYSPLKPCVSSNHIIIPAWDVLTCHIYDWSGEKLGEFTAHQMGLHDGTKLYRGSDFFSGHLSMLVKGQSNEWKIVMFKVG